MDKCNSSSSRFNVFIQCNLDIKEEFSSEENISECEDVTEEHNYISDEIAYLDLSEDEVGSDEDVRGAFIQGETVIDRAVIHQLGLHCK